MGSNYNAKRRGVFVDLPYLNKCVIIQTATSTNFYKTFSGVVLRSTPEKVLKEVVAVAIKIMADYPTGIYSPRTKENKDGVVYDADKTKIGYAEDVVKLDAEIVALETYVGINDDAQTTPVEGKILTGKADGKSKWEDAPAGAFSSRARAYLSGGDQSIPNAEWTKVTLNAEDYDGDDEFDIASNYRFVAGNTGYYVVTGQVRFVSPASGQVYYVSIYKEGADEAYRQMTYAYTDNLTLSVTAIVYLAAGERLELYVYHTKGSACDIDDNRIATFMAVHRLS